MGFSNRTWHVAYALAFADFPFCAAIAADGIDGSYLQATLGGWTYGLGYELFGEHPFGKGLEKMLERSPAFNASRIRAPLMLQAMSPSAPMFLWDTFSRLKHLEHPVELFIAPRIDRGTHNIQNPAQAIAIQSRTLDWWRYWLKDEEDPDSEKSSQYAAWHVLRKQRDFLAKRPRPPRLDWSAVDSIE